MAIDWKKLVYTNTATPHLDMYKQTEKDEKARAASDIANIETRRDEALTKSSAGYDNTAQQNWVNYMQAQKRLPSQLNSLGIRGGASESSLLRLGTNYGSNVAANEAARNTAADDIRSAYAQQIAERNSELAQTLSQASATAKENQFKWEKEQQEKDLQYFSGAIEGLYKSKKGYKKLIAKLKKSKDPNKEYKIMLARKAMNALGSSGGSGGSGGRRGYGGSGGYGGGYTNDNSNNPTSTKTDRVKESQSGREAAIRKSLAKSANKSTTKKKYNWDYNIKGTSSKKYYP